jgi:hypothetical protein
VNLAPLNEGDEIELDVWLPRLSSSGELHLSIPARVSTIRSSVEADPNAHRVVLNIPGDKKVFDKICRYIVDVQERSLRESTIAELSD